MRKLITMGAVALALAALPVASFAAELVKKQSPHSVTETLDRLETVLKEEDITVMARVDHGANADKVGMQLRPTQLLIFGKPERGTRLMQEDQTVGIDLPMKVLAWEDQAGQVWIVYEKPEAIASERGITGAADVVQTMSKGLDNLTDAAVKQ